MYGSREVPMGLMTVSVAGAACSIANCGEGIAFSLLVGGMVYIFAMVIYGLARSFFPS